MVMNSRIIQYGRAVTVQQPAAADQALKLNHNMPVDNNDSRRAAAKAWRERNPGYMAGASRLHRARRKRTLEEMQDAEATAQNDG